MFIKEYEEVEITVNNKSVTKWEKKLGIKIIDTKIKVHWSYLKSSTFRILFIKVKCDDCGITHERRIRDLNGNIHYCINCRYKGERSYFYGKPRSQKAIEGTRKFMEINGNPFTWESSKEKIRLKEPWKKTSEKNRGKKRSNEVKEKMSKATLLAFKEGRRIPTNGWAKKSIKIYNGLEYQSKYELNFLKYVESIGKFDLIERGPTISYLDSQDKEHLYYVDFAIKNTNIVFEIKSVYYWNKKLDINLLKKEYVSKIYDYYLIMDNNFNGLEKIFENV